MTSHRQQRIAEVLLEELSLLISNELSDPRLDDAMVTVTDVQVSPDLGNARVYIQHALPDSQTRHVLSALQHSTTFLRRALVENLHLRVVPELHFVVDVTEKRAQHVDEILDRIAAERVAAQQTPVANGPVAGAAATEQEDHADREQRDA
jgi:ribosome-binding factor A